MCSSDLERMRRQVALLNEERQEFPLGQQDGGHDEKEEGCRRKMPGEHVQKREQNQSGIDALGIKSQRGRAGYEGIRMRAPGGGINHIIRAHSLF